MGMFTVMMNTTSMSMILNGMALNLIHMITSMQNSNTSMHISRMFTIAILILNTEQIVLIVCTESTTADENKSRRGFLSVRVK
jgi:hypothetical protein